MNKFYKENNEEDTVTISRSRFNQFRDDSMFLDALVEAGVDNWDGYGDARDIYDSWLEDDDL